MRVPLEITLQFRTNGFYLNASDEIYVRLPRFTSGDGSGASGPSFEVHQHSWATLFQVAWHEHEHTSSQSEPFPLSNLTLRVREGRLVEPARAYEVRPQTRVFYFLDLLLATAIVMALLPRSLSPSLPISLSSHDY